MRVVVLDDDHVKLLTPEEAAEAYALPGVRQVWRVTDVWLEEAHQINMERR